VADPVAGELRSAFLSTAGGVMTQEAGAITGELELLTRSSGDGALEVLVRYAGADEWYAVSGSPVPEGEADHRRTHEAVLERLTTPGQVEDGNELPVDLSDA
jgi:hypothetical protein